MHAYIYVVLDLSVSHLRTYYLNCNLFETLHVDKCAQQHIMLSIHYNKLRAAAGALGRFTRASRNHLWRVDNVCT